MAGDEDDDVIACCTALLFTASVLLLKNRRKHAVWVKRYLRERTKYGVFNTLLPELATNDGQRWLHYLRMDVHTFEELFLLIQPNIERKKTKFRLDCD